MAEHHTRNTLEVTAWCKVCRRDTQHRVDDGRRGPCLEHEAQPMTKKQTAAARKREREAQNPGLFDA
jgi:ribosomal protein L44E